VQRKAIGSDGAERLGAIPAFTDLSLGERRELARLADELTAQAGEVLMRQGEPGYEFLILEQGSAEVLQDGERIAVMGSVEFFGELAVLGDGSLRTASVVALTDLRGIALTAHFMREMRDRMPAVGERIDSAASARLERDRRAGQATS
jgi:CRP/FNR family transcriptional regulator, cyclic AMP receptor protein